MILKKIHNSLSGNNKVIRVLSKNKHIESLINKIKSKVINKGGIEEICLSLSCLCSANCIFCPKERGQRMNPKFMPIELVDKVLDEVSSKEYISKHVIPNFQLGENGDATLHKNFLDILRKIKKKSPLSKKIIYTNFSNINKEVSEIIIKEKLLDIVHCNIDGASQLTYYEVKKLNFERIKKNVLDFISARNSDNSKCPLNIHIISFRRYVDKIHERFGFYPEKVSKEALVKIKEDDTKEIIKYWKTQIKDIDSISVPEIRNWAERERIVTKNPSKYKCPALSRLRKQCFIAPNGDWYACCFDPNYELILGNVKETSIDEVYRSKRMEDFIEKIRLRKYEEIGEPCKNILRCVNRI